MSEFSRLDYRDFLWEDSEEARFERLIAASFDEPVDSGYEPDEDEQAAYLMQVQILAIMTTTYAYTCEAAEAFVGVHRDFLFLYYNGMRSPRLARRKLLDLNANQYMYVWVEVWKDPGAWVYCDVDYLRNGEC